MKIEGSNEIATHVRKSAFTETKRPRRNTVARRPEKAPS
jgi:hypothetical protein